MSKTIIEKLLTNNEVIINQIYYYLNKNYKDENKIVNVVLKKVLNKKMNKLHNILFYSKDLIEKNKKLQKLLNEVNRGCVL